MHRRAFLLAAITLTSTFMLTDEDAHADAGFLVVLNKGNDTAALSRGELKKLVTGGTKQWKSGAAVQLGIIPSEAPETQYLSQMLDLSTKELLSRIQEQVFKGEMKRPVVLRSSAECIAFARSNPGAICIASAQSPIPPEARGILVR